MGMGGGCVSTIDPLNSPALCGTPDLPCQNVEDTYLPDSAIWRNDAPGLALTSDCLPMILFSRSELVAFGFDGYFATADATGHWSKTQTPFDLATGGLVAPNGAPFAVPFGSDGSTTGVWQLTDDNWNKTANIAVNAKAIARGVAQASTGTVMAAVISGDNELLFGRWGADGTSLVELGSTKTEPVLAISPSGDPHIMAWEPSANGTRLVWHSPPEAPKYLLPYSRHEIPALGVTAADANNPRGKPHALVAHALTDETYQLYYITHTGNDVWTRVLVEEWISYKTEVWPLGAVTDGASQVRLFYMRHPIQNYPEKSEPAQIIMVTPQSDTVVNKSVVIDSGEITGATFVSDGMGRIHVAAYDQYISADGLGVKNVRYVMLTP